ncbi:MAG: sugar transferase [Verrucomicrobiales bacterium]|nr:sugar transferase [Verrucomicrobiales bacterium]
MKRNLDMGRFGRRVIGNGSANGNSATHGFNGQHKAVAVSARGLGADLVADSATRSHGDLDRAVSVPRWKRVLDVTLVLVASPVLVPLMALIAVAIRLSSPGPALFRQERVGFRGRRFTCFKFRTMVVDADPGLHQGHLQELLRSDKPMVKMDTKGDPRVIPFGRLLRASGLDELPQIFNVLRGEMSLVGPRPCMPYEFEQYLPWQMERFNAMPGLTGLWQVSGKNRTTFNEMIRLDIQYARNQSLWLDLKIILKTVPALILQMRDQRAGRKALAQNGHGAQNGAAAAMPRFDAERAGSEANPSYFVRNQSLS